MGWIYEDPDGADLYDHEGWAEPLLADGTPPDNPTGTGWYFFNGQLWNGEPKPLATALRATCRCGWTGTTAHPIDWTHPDEDATEGFLDNTGPYQEWREQHIDIIARAAVPTELRRLLEDLEHRISRLTLERPLLGLELGARLERVGQSTIKSAALLARQNDESWETVGSALGVTRQAAHQRLSRYVNDNWTDPWN